ncbi:type III secretion system stator protein SctL [Burkholderia sp. AU28942]|uniref:type III secretion system stator protein SctL n=1 Tax=Burkholderia TaxID=32008 RepID=UPI0008421751|nr:MULTISPECIES: type III secretion system stator protein SctL [Burkholderia]AOK07295.1 serine kinase [Burkholderia latens]MCA8309849.1 type III secretion system stator protein SctL [Burkholderia sp. AU28942]QTO51198.1 type III secretion system stator protein SctL [Burkholderia latens]
MVIWLRNPQAEGKDLGVGVEGDVLRHERLAAIVEIDAAYAEMRRQCDEALDAARAQARMLLDEARARADELVERAMREFAQAAERGYDDGLRRGLTDWHERAAAAHAEACRLAPGQHDRLAELVTLAVEQIVASVDPKALFARAAATVERIVADGSPVHLRVHPSDLAAASAAFDEAAAAWREAGRSVRLCVAADATLAPGACVAETDLGAIDASLSLHLAAMRAALARAVRSVAKDPWREAPNAPPGEDASAFGAQAGSTGDAEVPIDEYVVGAGDDQADPDQRANDRGDGGGGNMGDEEGGQGDAAALHMAGDLRDEGWAGAAYADADAMSI